MSNVVGQALKTKPKLLRPSDESELVVEKTNYNVIDLWKRVNGAESDLKTFKESLKKPTSVLKFKNWRLREVGTDLILENYAGSAWTEDTRWTP